MNVYAGTELCRSKDLASSTCKRMGDMQYREPYGVKEVYEHVKQLHSINLVWILTQTN